MAALAAFCAMLLTFHGIFNFCKMFTSSLLPTAYPILRPAKPNDFVNERKINKLSYDFISLIND